VPEWSSTRVRVVDRSFSTARAPPDISTLSLHDALPISRAVHDGQGALSVPGQAGAVPVAPGFAPQQAQAVPTPQIDPEEFRDALYSGDPVEAIMKLVTPLVTQQVQQLGHQINAGLMQIVQPIQQYAQQQQAIRSFEEQLADVRRQ